MYRKRRRIGRIAGFVLIVVILLFLRSDWQQIGLGTLAFVSGSALVVWSDEKKEGKSSKWLKGICVPFILAVGGLLTTHGWNLRDNHFRDHSLLVAVATEWQRNDELIPEILLLRNIYDTNDRIPPITEFLLPSAQASHDVLIHSSFIHQDVILVRWLKNYYRVTNQFALALQDIRRLCSQPLATTEIKKWAIKQVFEDHLIFEYFRNGHRHLGEYLDVNYNWAIVEAKVRMDMTQPPSYLNSEL